MAREGRERGEVVEGVNVARGIHEGEKESSRSRVERANSSTAMTELEAQALAQRLTRVWASVVLTDRVHWELADEWFSFRCDLADFQMWFEQELKAERKSVEIRPIYEKHYPEDELQYRFLCDQAGESTASISLDNAPLFKERDLLLFRRGCWLSGCNIEATAHEKAEWIDGFSKEEIEVWDLKF